MAEGRYLLVRIVLQVRVSCHAFFARVAAGFGGFIVIHGAADGYQVRSVAGRRKHFRLQVRMSPGNQINPMLGLGLIAVGKDHNAPDLLSRGGCCC